MKIIIAAINKFRFLFYPLVFIVLSCDSSEEPVEPGIEHLESTVQRNDLIGFWFRSTPIKFSALPPNPAFERGEHHFTMKYFEDGFFEYRRTSLGFYENQNPLDSSAIVINSGMYELINNILTINIFHKTYITIFDGNEVTRDTSGRRINFQTTYQWPRAEFIDNPDSLKFTYHIITDVISSEQEVLGVDKIVELFKRI